MRYRAEDGSISIAVVGDVMITRPLSIFTEPEFLGVRDVLSSADATFANLESIVVNYGEGTPGIRTGTFMVTEPELLEDVKWLGINLVSTCNSHSLNFGEQGLLRQLDHLQRARLAHAGTGRNLREASSPTYRDTANGRVALIAGSAHLPSPENRAVHQRVDYSGKPGVNALRFTSRYVLDAEAFATLERIGRGLGLFGERSRMQRSGFRSAAELGSLTESEITLWDQTFVSGSEFAISTQCDEEDLQENLRQVREARRQADWVIVTLHNQSTLGQAWLAAAKGQQVHEQPEFVAQFAHECVDAGADVIVIHGPHSLMGIETYRGRPIFHSLGNLVLQNESLRFVPALPYQKLGLDPLSTPSDFFDRRSDNDTKGMPADRSVWEALIAVCRFSDWENCEIELHPVDLGFGKARSQRGRPMLAEADFAAGVLDRVSELSRPFGTKIERSGSVGRIAITR